MVTPPNDFQSIKNNSKTLMLENITVAHEKQKLSQRIIMLNELYEKLCYEKLFLETQNKLEDGVSFKDVSEN